MRRRSLIVTLALSASLLLAPPSSRADSTSGPDRQTLDSWDWGCAYVLESRLTGLRIETDLMRHKTFYRQGEMIGLDTEKTGVAFTFSSQDFLSVHDDDDTLTVRCGAQSATLRIDHETVDYTSPHEHVRYSKTSQGVLVEGSRGTLKVVEGSNGFRLTSAAGETRYERKGPGEPFALGGIPLVEHPYMTRGRYFERQGFGFYIDLHLERLSRAFALLPQDPKALETFAAP